MNPAWHNPQTYVGTGRDKATAWQYQRRGWSDLLLEFFADAFCRDDVVHAIATRTPEEMLSRGYEIWQGVERRTDLEDALGPDGINRDKHLGLALIELAKKAGFTIAETRELVRGISRRTSPGPRLQFMARKKLLEVEERIAEAERMRGVLQKMTRCECPTFEECTRTGC